MGICVRVGREGQRVPQRNREGSTLCRSSVHPQPTLRWNTINGPRVGRLDAIDATLKDLRKVVPNIKQAIMWSYEVWSELDAQIVKNWRMACILPATWNVGFALVYEREKNRMQDESYELGALISNLRLVDDEMSIEIYIQMEGEKIIELELSIDELVDATLVINVNVDLHFVDVDDVAPPT